MMWMLKIWSPQNYAHAPTAMLLEHEQSFVVMWLFEVMGNTFGVSLERNFWTHYTVISRVHWSVVHSISWLLIESSLIYHHCFLPKHSCTRYDAHVMSLSNSCSYNTCMLQSRFSSRRDKHAVFMFSLTQKLQVVLHMLWNKQIVVDDLRSCDDHMKSLWWSWKLFPCNACMHAPTHADYILAITDMQSYGIIWNASKCAPVHWHTWHEIKISG